MPLLPQSRKARARLMAVAIAAPVLALAVGLSLWAMRDAVVFFYGPSEARAQHVAPGRTVRLGGLVQAGSVRRLPGGSVQFSITDNKAVQAVTFHGDLPDLFREGQGVIAEGAFGEDGGFRATRVLAKHDEKYMPKEVADRLKASGEWRPEPVAGAAAQ
ncbi:MAG: cytochrome c maturation protein CcmE [Caulobacteraceae bacterium]|nr:cytochrome c maturation protein CcmE [Caulobacteraceae bacterium]